MKITNPQAFYSKTSGVSGGSHNQKSGSNKMNKNNWRSILTVVGLSLFFVVAMLGVMIAQRQRATKGPVAPSAPQSKPSAAETFPPTCSSNEITIVAPTVPEASGFTSVANSAKTAHCDVPNTGGTGQITAKIVGHKVTPVGDKFRYDTQVEVTRPDTSVDVVELNSYVFYCPTKDDFEGDDRVCNLQEGALRGDESSNASDMGGSSINDRLVRLQVKFEASDGLTKTVAIASNPYMLAKNTGQCGGWQADLYVKAYQIGSNGQRKLCVGDDKGHGWVVSTNNFTYSNCNRSSAYSQDACGGLPTNWCAAPAATATPTPVCNCTQWVDQSCGAVGSKENDCQVGYMYRTRTCPDSCPETVKSEGCFEDPVKCPGTGGPEPTNTPTATPTPKPTNTPTATPTPYCGDGVVQKELNEECDDGQNNSDDIADACRTNCKNAYCTDGVQDTSEACDDGNKVNDDTCSNQCTEPTCGDGIVNGNDECDDGNKVNDDTCRNNCKKPTCGDKIKDDNEQCDDGNNIDTDNCRNDCTFPPTFTCNSSCSSDADCQTVNAEYICDADAGNKCRLDTNRDSTTCSPPENVFSCNSSCETNEDCMSASANYICSSTYGNKCRLASNEAASNCLPKAVTTPTPAAGCNETCTANSDCKYSNYICFQTSSGSVCRLDEYPNSTTCSPPAVVNAYVPPARQTYVPVAQREYVASVTQAPTTTKGGVTQPELPAELPLTGPADWANWLKAGLVTLGFGSALLLLL